MRTYVIGDIHGCYLELDVLLHRIHPSKSDKFVFIGDYIDRGWESKRVIEKLISLSGQYECVFLRGNHEDMLLGFLGLGGHYGESFYGNGGGTTLLSYGVLKEERLPTGLIHKVSGYEDAKEKSLDMIPESHIEFLTNTQLYHDTKDILYVHAGLNPYLKLDENDWFDFTWVNDNRNSFFCRIGQKPWHKLLVHGHTMIPWCDVKKHLPHRVNVDTGLVYGKRLTCLVVDSDQPADNWEVVQVKKGETKY